MNKVLITLALQMLVTIYAKPKQEDIDMIFHRNFKPFAQIKEDSEDCIYDLCNNTKSYQEHETRDIVSKYKEYTPLFGQVLDMNRTAVSIASRFGQEEKSNMCKTRPITMFPRHGLTVDGQVKNIVNVKGYHQMVTFEACEEGAECYASEQYLPVGITSSCETQFIVIRLVVINEDDTLGLERFSIPAGCSCMYSHKI